MTDEMTEEYRELFADLAKKTSYTVGEATRKKMELIRLFLQ